MIEASTFAATMSVVRTMAAQKPNMTVSDILNSTEEVFQTLSELVEKSLSELTAEDLEVAIGNVEVAPLVPAVPIEDSVHDDYVICLEDGTKHKMMKRYLKRKFDLTPEAYKAKWGLPDDYPITAPGYSAQKAAEAHAVGLGHHANKRGAARQTEHNEQVQAAA